MPELTETEKMIALLEEQNRLIKSMADIMIREHRSETINKVIHALLVIIPSAAIIIIGYYLWTGMMHYLDALNNNINLLKSNYEALVAFFQKLVPDFSKIGSGLQQSWQDIQFWKHQ